MLLEEIGESLCNFETFETARLKLEESSVSGWLKPVRDNLWDSSVVGQVAKVAAHTFSGMVDGLVVGALVGLPVSGFIYNERTLNDFKTFAIVGGVHGGIAGTCYGAGKYIQEQSKDSTQIGGKIANIFAKTLLGAAAGCVAVLAGEIASEILPSHIAGRLGWDDYYVGASAGIIYGLPVGAACGAIKGIWDNCFRNKVA